MEESGITGDLRQSSFQPGGSFKPSLSGRSTPRNSPTFRRLNSSRTPRREGRSGGGGIQWFRSNRLVYWLLLITLWAYLGFYVQSRWAHGDDNKEEFLGFGNNPSNGNSDTEQNPRRDLIVKDDILAVNNGTIESQAGDGERIDVVLAKKENVVSSNKRVKSRKRSKRKRRSLRGKQKTALEVELLDKEAQEPEIPNKNSSYGLLVGPFGLMEDRILEWSPEKRSGTCDRKGDFSRLVWSRRFVLIFHELSMTGAPISMMELATELLSCGATVSAVVLSKKGGLMPELARRRIKVLEDRADLSFKTAMKADLVIAGSAVCASWIDQYIAHFPAGGSQVSWWIMENRREYFDRAKVVLNRVKMLIFLSESQARQWLNWCEEEKIKLRSQPAVVPLSVNDELAFVAGIASSLNTPSFSIEKMRQKRQLLRDSVRKEMGLTDNDMLVMSLSSINPGKGQLLLLDSARLIIEQEPSDDDPEIENPKDIGQDQSTLARKHHLRALLQAENAKTNELPALSGSFIKLKIPNGKNMQLPSLFTSDNDTDDASVYVNQGRKNNGGKPEQTLKILIGSVGSKSNKVPYVKGLLKSLSQHSNVSKSVLWTPATTRVGSLYSAADVYVINSQGLGETFGRVTIEAMAFGLPVLGTDAGGTKAIVDHNVTGLLHPLGHPGTRVLAQNLGFLLKNPLAREQMGMEGRKKVERMYLKRHMYKRFVE
ncbi:spore coat protein sa, partial [Fagus crenata]